MFEKAGVNVSVVYGVLPPGAAAQMRARGSFVSFLYTLLLKEEKKYFVILSFHK